MTRSDAVSFLQNLMAEADEQRRKGNCPTCFEPVAPEDFRDPGSVEEYRISGMCQDCQDRVFQTEETNHA